MFFFSIFTTSCKVIIYILSWINYKLNVFGRYSSIEIVHLFLIFCIIIIQDISNRFIGNVSLLSLLFTLFINPLLFYFILIYIYMDRNYNIYYYFDEFLDRIYRHKNAVILLFIYILIPKNYDKIDFGHILKEISLIFNIGIATFITPIIDKSMIKIKPHSLICNLFHLLKY